MNNIYCTLVLLAFVIGALADIGEVGDTCLIEDKCSDGNAYCDTTDISNKECKCNSGWVEDSDNCVRDADEPCGPSQCMPRSVCEGNSCQCDKSKGFEFDKTTGNCVCPPNTHRVRPVEGYCGKKIGEVCSVTSECIDNALCDKGTCTCDTSKYYAPGVVDDPYCNCDSTKAVAGNGKCLLKTGQPCSTTSSCINTDGMICTSGACACDTSKKYAAATQGSSSCSCETGYGKKADKSCGKLVSEKCSAGDVCVDNALCTNGVCTCNSGGSWIADTNKMCVCNTTHYLRADKTCGGRVGTACSSDIQCIESAKCTNNKCLCDASRNFNANAPSTTASCPCNANSVMDASGVCRKKVGQPCESASECIATPGMVCGGNKKCACDTTRHYATGQDGDISCACTPTTDYNREKDGSCALKLGKTCTTIGAPCVNGGMCDRKTLTCKCDTSKNFKPATDGLTCTCADDAVLMGNDSYCGKKINGTCSSGENGMCMDRTTCSLNETIGIYTCKCNDIFNLGRSCKNGAAGLAVSLAVLTTGLLLMSQLVKREM